MSGREPAREIRMLFYFFYGLGMIIFFLVAIRYVLRVGNPPGPPAQGAEVGSMRGDRILEFYRPQPNGDRDTIAVGDFGRIEHYLFTATKTYGPATDAPLDPRVLHHVRTLRDAWCTQPPPLPPPGAATPTYEVQFNCSTFTGRYFYVPVTQLPPALVELLRAAPPLAAR